LSDIETTIWAPNQNEDLLVYGIHGGEPAGLLANFVQQTGVTYPIIADSSGTLWDFDFPPGTGYPYPRDIVIDKNGVVRSIKNSFSVLEMQQLVESLLAEPYP
jgi:peroxiredoxin